MGNTQRQPLTPWAHRVEAMHTRRVSDEANEIREALPEDVRKDKDLVEHLVLFLMNTKASLDEHSDGKLPGGIMTKERVNGKEKVTMVPEGMTKEEINEVRKKARELGVSLQAVPGALKSLEPAFDELVRKADEIDAFLTAREDRIKGRRVAKTFIEDHIGYLLSVHKITLSRYVAGNLAEVLHVAYKALEGDPGTDASRAVRRVCDDADADFSDIEAHVRHHAFIKALLQLPVTHDPKELEKQGEAYKRACEAHEPESPSMCVVMAEAAVKV